MALGQSSAAKILFQNNQQMSIVTCQTDTLQIPILSRLHHLIKPRETVQIKKNNSFETISLNFRNDRNCQTHQLLLKKNYRLEWIQFAYARPSGADFSFLLSQFAFHQRTIK